MQRSPDGGWHPVVSAMGLAQNRRIMLGTPNRTSATAYPLAVIMQRSALVNRWITETWEAKGVVPDTATPGTPHSVIVREQTLTQFLFPGHTLRLQRGEAEGYYLNITSSQPKVFILWRMLQDLAQPVLLSVSYHQGARWADSGENVDGVRVPEQLLPWLGEFVEQHYTPEPRKQQRYASNKDKGHMGGTG